EFMAEKIKELPRHTQEIVQLAACLGNQFNLATLALVADKPIPQTADLLWDALQAGLITASDNAYQADTIFHFLHDHVQHAAYLLIEPKHRPAIHLKIGRLLFEHTAPDQLHDAVLDIVNQINFGIDLITHPDEREKVAALNLTAGKKALLSIAYKPALTYFKTGLALLTTQSWTDQYSLTLPLYTSTVEAAYLAAEPEEMEKYAQIAIQNIENLLDKMKIYEIQLHYLASQNKFMEAARLAINVLNLLGVNFPTQPTNFRIIVDLMYVKWLMHRKTITELDQLPDMTDPRYLAAMRILTQLGYVAYFIDRKLTLLVILNVVRLSVKYGNCAESANAYIGWAFMQCHLFHHFEIGYPFSQFALQLAERFPSDKVKIQVQYLYCHTILHWYDHVDKTLSLLLQTYHKALETGNIEYAGYCIVDYSYRTFLSGKELTQAAKEIEIYAKALASMGLKWSHLNVMSTLQVILNLLGTTENTALIGSAFDETAVLPTLIAEKDNIGIFAIYHNKLLLAYLFHHDEQAYEYLLEAKKYDDKMKSRGHFAVPAFCFITSLVYLARYRLTTDNKEKKQLLNQVKANQTLMKQWSHYAPMNFSQKYYLVEAEVAHITGHVDQAATYFDQAIQLAKQNRYLHEEALANELAALFYLAQHKEKIAKTYMTDAHYCYVKWGAVAKVKQVEKDYPHLLTNSPLSPTIADTVDLASLMKSAQAISREIILADLLKKMMHIVIENVGAQKGFLLLEKNGQWFIEAEGSIETEIVTVLQSLPLEQRLPITVIHYVTRTKTPLTLDDAAHAEQFAADPYIQQAQPKSVLCVPLINQGILSGLLYMENNLTTEAFTPNRLELINLLSGQIIVAIDNARLYLHLKELNQAYESFVP
ncbi:MAG: GAF domain-containing protein, partial [Gammaproteobacteria bacterium]